LQIEGPGLQQRHRYLSGVDFSYKASTCQVLLTLPSFLNEWSKLHYICPPPPQYFLTGGLRCRPILKEKSLSILYIAERTRKAVYI
jgi:hypothetical protein